jgi:tRNA threonylcarbamoyladenosine biosynthesis protein TsaB
LPPDNLILAFDTSAAHCAVAVLCDGRIVADAFEAMEKGQAERLMPLLEQVLIAADAKWADLTQIAVGIGPGNFTGVRIAVAAARGLALGLGIPAIGVTRLEALAYGLPRPVTVVEDARRGEVYVQTFDGGAAQIIPLTDLLTVDHATTGNAAPNPWPATMPLTHAIAHIAAMRTHPQPRPVPFYLRAADAAPSSIQPPVIL